jgi:monoamine oxidase
MGARATDVVVVGAGLAGLACALRRLPPGAGPETLLLRAPATPRP